MWVPHVLCVVAGCLLFARSHAACDDPGIILRRADEHGDPLIYRELDFYPDCQNHRHHCVASDNASTCRFHDVHVNGNTLSVLVDPKAASCTFTPHKLTAYARSGMETEEERAAEFAGDFEVQLSPQVQTCRRRLPGVFVPLSPYYPQNLAHVLIDDIYAVFLALSTFHAHGSHNVTLVTKEGVSDRVNSLFAALQLKHATMADLHDACLESVVHGLARKSGNIPLRHGYGVLADAFSAWILERANVHPERRKQLTVTVVKKDMRVADHPMSMANGDDVAQWIARHYPKAHVQAVHWSEMTSLEIIQRMAHTDVLVTSPGSDVAPAIYMQPGSAVVLVAYCRYLTSSGSCQPSFGVENYIWFRLAGYRNNPWRQIIVQESKLMPLVHDAVQFAHHQKAALRTKQRVAHQSGG